MVKIGARWFEGKVHKKTQVQLGFFRGEISCGQVTRFTLQKFEGLEVDVTAKEAAELYALEVTLRARGIYTSPTSPPTPLLKERGDA